MAVRRNEPACVTVRLLLQICIAGASAQYTVPHSTAVARYSKWGGLRGRHT